ncbi:MAG TPA: hypothetical protein VFN71_15530 [Methylomirabilota bacterium]|nr:hypothetical protein [Methylomirabilota bacterium]
MARRVTGEAELARVDDFETGEFTPAEKAVLRFTEAFYADHRKVPDQVWAELGRHWTEPEIIEIAWTISAYIMLGKLIYAFRIPYEGGTAAEAGARP